MNRSTRASAAALALAAGLGCSGSDEPTPATTAPAPSAPVPTSATLRIGKTDVEAELATTPAARSAGLGMRRDLPQDHGLLLVYGDDRPRFVSLFEAALPLTIAFVDAKGRITDLADAEPDPTGMGDSSFASSSEPARYALFMVQGWFAGHGVKAGDVIELPAWLGQLRVEPDPAY
jgi:uncharacterized protein